VRNRVPTDAPRKKDNANDKGGLKTIQNPVCRPGRAIITTGEQRKKNQLHTTSLLCMPCTDENHQQLAPAVVCIASNVVESGPRYIVATTIKGEVKYTLLTSRGPLSCNSKAVDSVTVPVTRPTALNIDDRITTLLELVKTLEESSVLGNEAVHKQHFSYVQGGEFVMNAVEHDRFPNVSSHFITIEESKGKPNASIVEHDAGVTTCLVNSSMYAAWISSGGHADWIPLSATSEGVARCNRLLGALYSAESLKNWLTRSEIKQSCPMDTIVSTIMCIKSLLPQAMLGDPFLGASIALRRDSTMKRDTSEHANSEYPLLEVVSREKTLLSNTVMLRSSDGTVLLMGDKALSNYINNGRAIGKQIEANLIDMSISHSGCQVPALMICQQLPVRRFNPDNEIHAYLSSKFSNLHRTIQNRGIPQSPCRTNSLVSSFETSRKMSIASYMPLHDNVDEGYLPFAVAFGQNGAIVDNDAMLLAKVRHVNVERNTEEIARLDKALKDALYAVMDTQRHKHTPGSYNSTTKLALTVLKNTAPRLLFDVNQQLQETTIGRSQLFNEETLKLVHDTCALPHEENLHSRLTNAKNLAECLENSCESQSTSVVSINPIPAAHAKQLGAVFDICAVSEDLYGEKDGTLLFVRHGSALGKEDISAIFPSDQGTDPHFFSTDPRMQADLLRKHSSVRFALGIGTSEFVQWGPITAINARCAVKYMAPPNGALVDSRISALCVVNWTNKEGPQRALMQVMAAQRVNALDGVKQNGMSRVVTMTSNGDTYTTFDKKWKIRALMRL
jgi:hypothetical protein